MARKETNFKQTDIGLIPHDWKVIRLGEVYDTTSGGTPSRAVSEYWKNGKIKWVTTSELLDGYITNTNECITELGLQNSSAKVFPLGTLLLAMYGATIGKLGILDCSAATNQACCAIFSKQDSHIIYLYYYLQYYRDEIVALGRGAGQPNISQEIVRNKIITLPPTIEEQRRIAEVLSHFDEHIDNLVALLEKRKQVKTATMHALLSGTTRLPGFTQPWKEKLLSELFLVLKGNGLSKSVVGNKGKYPCILYGQLFTTYKENIQSVVSYTDLDEGVSSNEGDVLMPASTTTSGEDLAIASAL